MKTRSSGTELTNELEKDLALVMLIEKRHSAKIGAEEARELIERVKDVLHDSFTGDEPSAFPQDFVDGFPIH